MSITYYGYPKCSTCKKAEKWFEVNGVAVDKNDISKNPPTEKELSEMIASSGLELKKFFNVSGQKYRELNLKDKLPTMTDGEKISLLASDGMLIKRPLVYGDGKVTVGFSEDNFENTWTN